MGPEMRRHAEERRLKQKGKGASPGGRAGRVSTQAGLAGKR